MLMCIIAVYMCIFRIIYAHVYILCAYTLLLGHTYTLSYSYFTMYTERTCIYHIHYIYTTYIYHIYYIHICYTHLYILYRYGFQGEILHKYDNVVYKLFNEVFANLPLAAVIHNEVFVVHGGIRLAYIIYYYLYLCIVYLYMISILLHMVLYSIV